MKKSIPAILLCLLMFGCKKDKSTTSASIIGTWTINSNVISYYDKNGKLTGTDDNDADTKVVFKSDGTATGTSADGDVDHSTYTIATVNGQKRLKITTTYDDQSQDLEDYEIVTLTGHNLELKSEATNDDTNIPYAKLVVDVKASR